MNIEWILSYTQGHKYTAIDNGLYLGGGVLMGLVPKLHLMGTISEFSEMWQT